VVLLPSGQLTTPDVVTEISELIELGEEVLADPDARANAGEFLPLEELDEDES